MSFMCLGFCAGKSFLSFTHFGDYGLPHAVVMTRPTIQCGYYEGTLEKSSSNIICLCALQFHFRMSVLKVFWSFWLKRNGWPFWAFSYDEIYTCGPFGHRAWESGRVAPRQHGRCSNRDKNKMFRLLSPKGEEQVSTGDCRTAQLCSLRWWTGSRTCLHRSST